MTDFERLAQGPDRPFSLHPRTDRYYPAASAEDARQRLGRVIHRGNGPGILIGATGTGKSLMLRVLAEQFEDQFCVACLACGQLATPRALLQAILFELGLPYRDGEEGELRLMLMEHLRRTDRFPEGLLLLVDEAQTLPTHLLEELRMLTNVVIDSQPRVRIILAGSPALEETFASPELESLSQRLAARCYLTPMNHDETAQYVAAQLAVAGFDAADLMEREALDAIYEATDGVPRLINQLCDNALLFTEQQNATRISRHIIQEAWSDLQQLPAPWTENSLAPSASRNSGASILEFGSLTSAEPLLDDAGVFVEELPDDELDSGAAVVGFAGRSSREPVVGFPPVDRLEDTRRPVAAENKRSGPQTTRAFVAANLPPAEPAEDPFVESFAEEEIILNSMLGLEIAFGPNVPRVENRRETGLSSMVVETLEDMGQAADWNRPELAGTFGVVADHDSTPSTIGRMPRLAPKDQPEYDTHRKENGPKFWSPPNGLHDYPDDRDQSPASNDILVIEEPETEQSPNHGSRPQNYRQLFARLRGM